MPRLIVTLDGGTAESVPLLKERTTLGRRPYNDIVINHLTVSGEHAVFKMTGNGVVLEDLNSTNGTYVDGVCIRQHTLKDGQVIDVGICRMTYVDDGRDPVSVPSGTPDEAEPAPRKDEPVAVLQVVDGPAKGRELRLHKVVNTFGRTGVSVAAVTRRQNGYTIAHVEGTSRLRLNGVPLGETPAPLRDGDLIELGETRIRFVDPTH